MLAPTELLDVGVPVFHFQIATKKDYVTNHHSLCSLYTFSLTELVTFVSVRFSHWAPESFCLAAAVAAG